VTDAERDAKLRESVADVIACPHTYPSGSDYAKAARVMLIIRSERERVREECAREAEKWCLGCQKKETFVIPPESSIVGQAAVHSSGLICIPNTIRFAGMSSND